MEEKKLGALSVKDIGEFSKKYRVEVFLCLLLLLTCIFNFIFVGGAYSIIAATVGAMIGVLMTSKIEPLLKSVVRFPLGQQMPTQIVLAAAILVIGIFLPFIIFFFLGLYAGQAIYKKAIH